MKHAIIGCGRVSPNHVVGCKAASVEIKWACDIDYDKAVIFAKKYNIKNVTDNYLDILKDSEITSVSIATDHGSHAKLAIDALNKGKHVVIEKPIAINVQQAKEIVRVQKVNNKIVTVCFQHRFDPLIQKIKEIINKKYLGIITAINASIQCSKNEEYYSGWRGKLETEGGSTLINQGIHTLDLLIWFFGQPQIISAFKDSLKFNNTIETEDTLVSLLKFPNKALGTFLSTNTSVIEWDSYIEIIGTEGRVAFTTDFPNKLMKCDIPNNPILKEELEIISNQRETLPLGFNYYGISHKDVFSNFFNALRLKETINISAIDALKTTEIVSKLYKYES